MTDTNQAVAVAREFATLWRAKFPRTNLSLMGLEPSLTLPILEAVLADRDRLARGLDEVTDLDRSALKQQELRDDRSRAVRMWHEEKKRAEAAAARVAELEAKLASITAPTPYGRPGVQWAVDHHGTIDGQPTGDVVPVGEKAARTTVASWRAAGLLPDPVLLRREHTAWHRWPLDEEEAERMSADAARSRASEPSRHDSPRCAPAGSGCACQGGAS